MSDPDVAARWAVVDAEARKLGYDIAVDEAPNMPAPITHMAFAHRDTVQQPTMGAFLTYSISEIDAAEAGLEVLRRVVENGEPWPTPEIGNARLPRQVFARKHRAGEGNKARAFQSVSTGCSIPET